MTSRANPFEASDSSPAPPRQPGPTGAWVAAAIVIAISLLSTFTVSTSDQSSTVAANTPPPGYYVADEPGVASEAGAVNGEPGAQGPRRVAGAAGENVDEQIIVDEGTSGSTGDRDGAVADADCEEGENAGASDVGISANKVNLAATVVKTGIAKDFLSEAQFGMEAVVQKINREGGICHRLVEVKYDDDGWVQAEGGKIIQKYIAEKKYFGLAVNPSSEGLLGASGHIKAEGMPVIGADGMLIDQYQNEWIWPVAVSTHSVMHIMCMDAYERGARTFALVYEGNYRFGVEGERAFSGCVSRRPGAKMVEKLNLQGGQQGYQTQANEFVGACGGDFSDCDFVALLLEPATATTWRKSNGMGDGKNRPKVGFGAPQPLFVNSFVKDCGAPCANLRVWTSFKPPIQPFDKDPAVQAYVNDLRAVSSSADASNPHVQGAYQGMLLLEQLLEELGAAPTREGARRALDGMCLDTGLAPESCYKPGNHFAVTSALAFEAVYNITSGGATFTGWAYTNSGFKEDTEVDKDLG